MLKKRVSIFLPDLEWFYASCLNLLVEWKFKDLAHENNNF